MSLLPRQLLSVVILISLITYLLSLITGNIYAAGPPDPQPCKNALDNAPLTNNYVAPIVRTITRTGTLNQPVTISIDENPTVDFSKLQSLFATPNSNYLEGQFQDDPHRTTDITNLSSQDFNSYHGSGQKAASKVMIDGLKQKYVNYVYNKPTLLESTNKYTDIEGKDPKTVYELVNDFGLPNPPDSSASNSNKEAWLNTWGRYWEKIPTAYQEFYFGELQFRMAVGDQQLKIINDGKGCPLPIRIIRFVLPEFGRTTSISDQLNQIVVPCAAQSWRHGPTEEKNDCGQPPSIANNTTGGNTNILASAISFCKKLIDDSTKDFSKTLRKVVQISLNIITPVKKVYAANDDTPKCVKVIKGSKNSSAPFCALPQDQYHPELGEHCNNPYGNLPNQLDPGNQNVVCTFHLTWPIQLTIKPPDPDPEKRTPDNFDSCTDNGDGTFTCSITIRIWPVFRIPWLAEIWNNSLYSDQFEKKQVSSYQETGRPGIYSFFTPEAARAPNTHLSDQETLNFAASAKDTSASDPKESFMGGTDNGKNFAKDCALKPKALQEYLNIQTCDNLNSAP